MATKHTFISSQDFTTKEALIAAINEKRRRIAEKDKSYFDKKGNIQFRLDTKFRWGRHKGNQLRDVYKVEPSYVEWCILTCSGIGIFEEDLKLLQTIPVFDLDELNAICHPSTNPNEYYIDFRSYQRDKNGFLFRDTIYEYPYHFSEATLNHNRAKIERGLDFRNYQFGIPDDNNLQMSNILLAKRGIKINLKVNDFGGGH